MILNLRHNTGPKKMYRYTMSNECTEPRICRPYLTQDSNIGGINISVYEISDLPIQLPMPLVLARFELDHKIADQPPGSRAVIAYY